jgi:hypothetical protein
MHCQWTLPEGDADFSGRMREIKAGFTRRIARQAERTVGLCGNGKAASGSGDFGNTRSGMNGIMRPIWITSISTR